MIIFCEFSTAVALFLESKVQYEILANMAHTWTRLWNYMFQICNLWLGKFFTIIKRLNVDFSFFQNLNLIWRIWDFSPTVWIRKTFEMVKFLSIHFYISVDPFYISVNPFLHFGKLSRWLNFCQSIFTFLSIHFIFLSIHSYISVDPFYISVNPFLYFC